MTEMLDQLERRLVTGRGQGAREPWQPPLLDDFARLVRVTACDGSLGNFGWIRLYLSEYHVIVERKGTIHPHTDQVGYLGTWDRAIQLERGLSELDLQFAMADHIAVEAPMVVGGHRTESSLIAGLMVWRIAPPRKRIDVGATHVSSVLLGDAKVGRDKRKNAIKAAVARYIPGSDGRDWNEHERDAAAIALTVLWDLAHR